MVQKFNHNYIFQLDILTIEKIYFNLSNTSYLPSN